MRRILDRIKRLTAYDGCTGDNPTKFWDWLPPILYALIIILLASTAWGQSWERPDPEKNKRVHHNNSRHMRIDVDDSTFTLAKWDDLDAPAYMRLILSDISPSFFEMSGDTIMVNHNKFTARFYMADEHALEWEIIFYSKPNKNSWTFPIDTENLEYLYQPLVLPDDPYVVIFDYPDSVAGSYAVYHSSKRWNEYKTGKAFHIYRPKAYDSAGDTVWLDLSIDTVASTMTIAGKREWFRNAIYPVTVDPYFGYQSSGSTSSGLPNWPCARGNGNPADQYTASTGDVVDSIYFFAGDNKDDAYFGVYTTTGDVPNTRVDTTGGVELPATDAWNVLSCNIALSDGVEYTLVFRADQDITTYLDVLLSGMFGDNGTGFPATFSNDFTQNYRVSLYAKYTAGGAVADISHVRRRIHSVEE